MPALLHKAVLMGARLQTVQRCGMSFFANASHLHLLCPTSSTSLTLHCAHDCQVNAEERNHAKRLAYAILYGMGPGVTSMF